MEALTVAWVSLAVLAEMRLGVWPFIAGGLISLFLAQVILSLMWRRKPGGSWDGPSTFTGDLLGTSLVSLLLAPALAWRSAHGL